MHYKPQKETAFVDTFENEFFVPFAEGHESLAERGNLVQGGGVHLQYLFFI